MRRYNWIAGIILFVGIIMAVGQGCYFVHLLRNTIQKESSGVGYVIAETTDELSMVSAKCSDFVSYDMGRRELYYVIDGEEIVRELKEDASNYWVMTAPFYDIRDSSIWTLAALDTLIQEKLGRHKRQALAMRLTERDSTGRILRTFGEGRTAQGIACHYDKEMGYLSRNRLEADFIVPYAAIWEEIKNEAELIGIIAVLTACGLILLYRYFRIEGENARMRAFYMSLYRHDLRTPISVISNRVYCLKKEGREQSAEKERSRLEAIDTAAKQIGKGVAQLVAVQVCEGKVRVDFRNVDVNELLWEVVERERWYMGADSKARIETELRAERATVRGNFEALESMFQNVIENALKYGGDEPEVRVSSENTADGGIRVVVADSGEGIPQEELKHIFKRRYRGKQERGKIAGTGMGLHMVRVIVKAHRGRVDAESEAGRGCRFTIVLPLKKEEK